MSDTAATDPRKLAESYLGWIADTNEQYELQRLARELLVALDRVAALEQERDLAAKAARDQAAGVGYQAAHTFAAESRLAAYREAADQLAEALRKAKVSLLNHLVVTALAGIEEALSVYATLQMEESND